MKKIQVKNWVGRAKMTSKVDRDSDEINGNIWQILGTPLFGGETSRVLNIIREKFDSGMKKYWIATVNPEFVMEAEKDAKFKEILKKTDLNVVDGIGLIWARETKKSGGNKWLNGFKIGTKILKGEYRNQVVSGADLMADLAQVAAEKKLKMFFLGGFGKRAWKSAKYFQNKFGLKDSQIAWSEGEPNIKNEEVLKQINKFKPDILLVAYGMKKQELWIDNNLDNLNVGVVMGVGRSFDYYSGELKRAPKKWQKIGLEWLYSLIKEPKRLKRQLVLPKFVWKVLTK